MKRKILKQAKRNYVIYVPKTKCFWKRPGAGVTPDISGAYLFSKKESAVYIQSRSVIRFKTHLKEWK